MAYWNMCSSEVSAERKTVRAYGVERIQNRVPCTSSYKKQSLRELALRLELEDVVKSLREENRHLIDRVETLELQLDLDRRSDHCPATP